MIEQINEYTISHLSKCIFIPPSIVKVEKGRFHFWTRPILHVGSTPILLEAVVYHPGRLPIALNLSAGEKDGGALR